MGCDFVTLQGESILLGSLYQKKTKADKFDKMLAFILNFLCNFLRRLEPSFLAFHNDISKHDVLDVWILAFPNLLSDNPFLYLAMRLRGRVDFENCQA